MRNMREKILECSGKNKKSFLVRNVACVWMCFTDITYKNFLT